MFKAICIDNKNNQWCYKDLVVGKTYTILDETKLGEELYYRVRSATKCHYGCPAWYWSGNFVRVSEIDEKNFSRKLEKNVS